MCPLNSRDSIVKMPTEPKAELKVEAEAPAYLRHHQDFQSQILPGPRPLVVYVPPDYESATSRRYPALYLHDGQNVFERNTAFGGVEWQVDETAQALISAGEIEPLIVVGIYNAGEERINEYTPTADATRGGGKAALHGRMLLEEIKPFIDAHYRTLQGPANTGLGGSSLGGLVTLYLGIQYPQIFGKLAVLSPSVWWDNRVILKMIATANPRPRPKIWLDMGTSEGGMSLEDVEALRDVLQAKGWSEHEDLYFGEFRGAKHNEAAWAKRVDPFLRYLFPRGSRR